MAPLNCEFIQFLLKLDQPTWHQMNIIENNPISITMSIFETCHCDDILTLTHGDIEVRNILHKFVLFRQAIKITDDICSRGENELNGGGWGRVRKGLVKNLLRVKRRIAISVC